MSALQEKVSASSQQDKQCPEHHRAGALFHASPTSILILLDDDILMFG
jgi:hypothetical protein